MNLSSLKNDGLKDRYSFRIPPHFLPSGIQFGQLKTQKFKKKKQQQQNSVVRVHVRVRVLSTENGTDLLNNYFQIHHKTCKKI